MPNVLAIPNIGRFTRRSGGRFSRVAGKRASACPARPSSSARSARRASPSDAPSATCRRPGWSNGAPDRARTSRHRRPAAALSFGLLIPDLGETEIFEPICQGMMASPLAREHALVWGSLNGAGASKDDHAWQLCHRYIDRRVSGVFFAPLELTPERTTSICGSRERSTKRAFRLCCSIGPCCPTLAAVITISSGSTTGGRLRDHLASSRPRLPSNRVRRAPECRRDGRCARSRYREALYARDVPIDRALVQRSMPADAPARSHADGFVSSRTQSCAPTIGRPGV